MNDHTDARTGRGWTLRTMELGQHSIAVVLVLISCLRALAEGAEPVLAIGVGVAFLVWYGLGALRIRRSDSLVLARWWLLVLAGIWAASVVVSAEFIWMAFLLWLLAGHLLGLRSAIGFTVIIYAITVIAPLAHHGYVQTPSLVGSAIGAVFALGLSRGYIELLREARVRNELLESLRRANGELVDLQDELALTQRHAGQMTERTRIARDIHDSIAQEISSMRLLAHAEATRTTDPGARRVLEQLEGLAGQSSANVRRIISALAPSELEDGALTAALRRLVARLSEESGVHGEVDADESLPLLPAEVEVAILRVAQSTLANVGQHAEASRVRVSLMAEGRGVRMDIVDDGRGADGTDHGTGFGLGFVASRMRELGGEMLVETAPGQGFAVSVTIPVRDPAEPTARRADDDVAAARPEEDQS